MKLVAKAKALAVATKAAAGAIDDKTASEVRSLATLLIDAADYNLRFVGTDLDLAIAVKCSGDGIIKESGRCAVTGEALSKLLAGVAPDAEAVIETVGSGLQIKRRTRSLQVAGTAGGRFPRGAGDVVDRGNGVEPRRGAAPIWRRRFRRQRRRRTLLSSGRLSAPRKPRSSLWRRN